MRNRKTQGFTLIELLIVIAIIGILAAVLIPNLLSARQRAFDTAAQSCARSIATAQEVFAIDSATSAYATTLAALNQGMVSGCSGAQMTVTPGTTAWNSGAATDAWHVQHAGGSAAYLVDATGIRPGTRN